MYKTNIILSIFCAGVLHLSETLESPRVVAKVTVLPTQKSSLGEGPYYDELRKVLYYTDSFGGDFIRLDLVSGNETKIHVGGTTTIIIPYANSLNEFIVSKDNQLLKLNWDTKEIELIAEISSPLGKEKFNDAKCDARGRLIIGSTTSNALGGIVPNASSVYRLDENFKLTKIVEGISVSNGMSWSNDIEHGTFYLNDFWKRIIYAFDYDITDGTLSNQRELIVLASHPDFTATEFPDGMVIDQFGFIWVAMYQGGRIVKINPDTARVVDEIRFPRANSPTSMAFGYYRGEFGLFVTTGLNLLDGGRIHHVSFQGGQIKEYDPSARY
jgi:sugar lactone lactonase YvrE